MKKENNNIIFSVEDDGKGIDIKSAGEKTYSDKGVGIEIMKERAKLLGGTFDIISQPGKGTKLKLIFPKGRGNN